MRNLVVLGVLAVVLFFGGRHLGERKADNMLDLAISMTADGRFDEALRELDDLQSWFSWTAAGEYVEEQRKVVRRAIAARDESRRWEAERQAADRAFEEEQARQQAHERELEASRTRRSGSPRPIKPR